MSLTQDYAGARERAMKDFPYNHRSLSLRLVTFAWKNGSRVTDVTVATSRLISNAVKQRGGEYGL
jgi:hypothetical protein